MWYYLVFKEFHYYSLHTFCTRSRHTFNLLHCLHLNLGCDKVEELYLSLSERWRYLTEACCGLVLGVKIDRLLMFWCVSSYLQTQCEYCRTPSWLKRFKLSKTHVFSTFIYNFYRYEFKYILMYLFQDTMILSSRS